MILVVQVQRQSRDRYGVCLEINGTLHPLHAYILSMDLPLTYRFSRSGLAAFERTFLTSASAVQCL